ncbi:MAG: pyrroline-5-carboxylate reductase [Pseudomonadota bacterium]
MSIGSGPIWLVGGGKMGSALAGGWIARGLAPGNLTVVEPNAEAAAPWIARGTAVCADARDLVAPATSVTVVLAVKPQTMPAVLTTLADRVPAGSLVLSIAAGVPLATFTQAFLSGAVVVRAMPNTPAAVGRGITALVAGGGADAAACARADELMAAVGETVWLEREADLHAVTALSGGGPAYLFLLIEALAAAGARAGLDPALAMRLARATVVGAGELARVSEEHPETLRRNVTSPGGTTAEALRVLMADDGVQALFDRALAAAAARSVELGGEEQDGDGRR